MTTPATNDDDAVGFREWWDAQGSAAFQRWVLRQQRAAMRDDA
jgi:hypothetical protein